MSDPTDQEMDTQADADEDALIDAVEAQEAKDNEWPSQEDVDK